MTPAPISVDRLRELLALATPSTRWVVTCDGFSIVTDDEPMHRSHVASCVEPDDAALIAEAITALPALLHQLAELKANLAELRQACWEARAVLGFDNDGDPTPDALVYPSLADLVRRDAAEFRKDYDEACNEAHAAERAREEACGLLRDVIAWRRTVPMAETPNRKDGGIFGRIAAFLAARGRKAQ